MSEFLAEQSLDPASLVFLQCEDDGENRLEINVAKLISDQLGIKFDLRTLAMDGQIRLLEKSEKYGAIFLSFGPYLIALRNEQLYAMTSKGEFPTGGTLTAIKLEGTISFINVCDEVDCMFVQSQDGGLIKVETSVLLQQPKLAESQFK